jgi:ABC-2 type transport system permease protein
MLRARTTLLIIFAISVAVIAISTIATTAGANSPDDDGGKKPLSVKMGFVDRDGSAAVSDMISYFENDLGVKFTKADDADTLNRDLVDKNISAIAEAPEGFERSLLEGNPKPVELTFLDDYKNEAFVKGYFHTYAQSISVLAAASGGDAETFERMLKETSTNEPDVRTESADAKLTRQESDREAYRFMLGFFMMFSFMMSITISQMLHSDRLDGTFRRIKASNATSLEYISSVACIGFVIALVIEGPALIIWNATGGYSDAPVGVTALMLFAFATLVNSVGVFIGIAMPSFGGITAVAIAISTITSMFGGAWFPLEFAPRIFTVLSKFTPQYWMYEVVSSYEDGNGAFGIPLAILLLASLLFLILSGILFSNARSGGSRVIAR